MELDLIWQPQPRQALALASPAFELFYGGAAGGGKSDFLLIDWTDGIQYGKGHRGIIFRRSYQELEELITRSQELFPRLGYGNANWRATHKTWTINGATLKFRYLEKDPDVFNYQGHQYTWIGWDELTNWPTDFPYVYMISRARSPQGLPVRIRSAGNPGGVGHAWVKERFIDGKEPERIYQHHETEQTLQFIPAKLEDNQILLKKDPAYVKRLQMLPPHLKRAYLEGDWNIFAGQVFEEFRYERHVVKPFPLDPSWKRWVSLDWGYQKPFSVGWWAITGDGRMIRYREMYGGDPVKRNTGIKKPAIDVAKEAYEISAPEGATIMVADPAIWGKVDEGPSIAEIFQSVGWNMVKANNDRLSGLQRIHDLLSTNGFDGRPMLLMFSTCHDTIRTLPLLVSDPRHPEDVDTTMEDHAYDEMRYGVMYHAARPTSLRPAIPKQFKQSSYQQYDPLG